MTIARIVAIASVLVLLGCGTSRGYRAGGSQVPGGFPTTAPPSSLGEPSSIIDRQDSSSAKPPSGPVLLAPEARRDNPAGQSSASIEAPPPRARTSRYRPEPTAETVSAAERPTILNDPTWSRYYRSTDRRPIETLILGTGATRIALLSSMHGDETQSASLVEELARFLRRHPEQLRGVTVLLVKSPNPDGLFSRSPYNVHGVDLNRNFASANWKPLANDRAGARGASEIETRHVMRLLSDFHPWLVVHLKDSRNGNVVNFEGKARARADRLAGLLSAQVVEGLGAKTSGSVENYTLTRLACPSVTLLLAREESDEAAWARYRDALLALFEQTPSAQPDEQPSSLDEEPDPFEERQLRQSSLRRKPAESSRQPANAPPAQTNERSSLPEFPLPVPEHGYLELPPP